VQQKQGRVEPTIQAKGVEISDDEGLEAEADVMGEKASRASAASIQSTPLKGEASASNGSSPVIQRVTYDELADPMQKGKVDQWSDQAYANATQEFEFKMSPKIMNDPEVNAVVDVLLTRVHTIVKAWANATSRELGETYEREFGWPPGDQYYGAFEMTAENIQEVFEDTSQPMRTKLKLVYNAVRNNNLAKWLKLAAIELDRKAKGKTPRDWKIKTATQNVVGRNKSGKAAIVKGKTKKETVKAGFAEESGIESWMSPEQVTSTAATAETEKMTEHGRSKRDVFGPDRFSNVMGWKPETTKANKERRGGASQGLSLDEQRTLTVGDVPDLTDAEIDLLYKQQGKPKPDDAERNRFRTDPNAKIAWSQGGEFYDVNLDSDSAKAAAEVKARMEAGISGSTDLMLHAMQNLGLGDSPELMKGMRLALAGWMMANRDHSFYEVYKAAESYGVPFDIDKQNPGMEYESANNLYPMKKEDFADTLPHGKFPRYFLSKEYKDHLANNLGAYAQNKATYQAWLRGVGLPDKMLSTLDERAIAELYQLSLAVSNQPIDPNATPAKKNQAVRRMKQQTSFIYLATNLPKGEAEAMLTSLLEAHHSGKGVVLSPEDTFNALAGAGIPRQILMALPPEEIAKVEAVRKAVASAKVTPSTGALDMGPINTALAQVKTDATTRDKIREVLVQTYHGNAPLAADAQGRADETRKIAAIENIAQMQKTSGTWYSWGSPGMLQGYVTAPSIKQATANVPSTQGPGLYLASTAWRSSIYASQNIPTLMVAFLRGVPTIDIRNKAQMSKLEAVLGPPAQGDPLEQWGIYKTYRTDMMLIYAKNGNFARLTTNQGVELTLDMSRVPASTLKAEYGKLAGEAKDPFKRQAQQFGVDVSTWM
jgi:hypothetical protein